MIEALIEFFILGQVPGTNFTIGYRTSLFIAGALVVLISLYATLRYRHYLSRRISDLTPEKLIELKTI
jgi:hypothetical protein